MSCSVVRLACLALLCGMLSLKPALADQRPNLADPGYTFCEANTDCKIIHPRCSAPITVNQRHYIETDMWFRHEDQYKSCDDSLALPEVKSNSCVNHRCALELTAPVPQKPDNSKQAKDPTYCDKDDECAVVLGDCCEKRFYNTKNAPRIQADINYHTSPSACFFPDRRHVANLRCEKHKCTADLIVPPELDDPDHNLKGHCEQ